MMVSDPEEISCSDLKLELIGTPSGGELEEQSQSSSKGRMFPSPGHQSSILSLTLDEIQLKSGKSFGSMNMDEFLTSIWSVEEGSSSSLPSSNRNEPGNDHDKTAGATGSGSLLRQASFSIPTPLCNKTVDEVWFEIHKDKPEQQLSCKPPGRQQTFGEMTLEDFLMKAGIVQETTTDIPSQHKTAIASAFLKPPPGFGDSTPSLDSSYGMRNLAGLGFISCSHGSENNPPCNGFMSNCPVIYGNSTNRHSGDSSCDAPGDKPYAFTEMFGLKSRRISDGPPEMVVERRQRRMIKNRESAARSRARKQAYTVELEVELNQLKEENDRLKNIMAEIEERRRKEVMKRKQPRKAAKAAGQFRAMRRTVSVAW